MSGFRGALLQPATHIHALYFGAFRMRVHVICGYIVVDFSKVAIWVLAALYSPIHWCNSSIRSIATSSPSLRLIFQFTLYRRCATWPWRIR